jgi:predicted GH43/DUF377 family glycosyl hydrolase
MNKLPLRLFANPRRVVTRFLSLHGSHRIRHIADRVARFSDEEVQTMLADARALFEHRHRRIDDAFRANYHEAVNRMEGEGEASVPGFSEDRKLLLGACQTMEYSIQAAALFNPSIVRHPDQTGVDEGAVRFVMSLRATGESHVSSVEFRTGTWHPDADTVMLDEVPQFATRSGKDWSKHYDRAFVRDRLAYFPQTNAEIVDALPDTFTAREADTLLTDKNQLAHFDGLDHTRKAILEILDTNYDLLTDPDVPLAERVIFPNAKGESNGMEDVRFAEFRDGNETHYYSTYTAYDGKTIKSQLMETTDFVTFRVRTMYGPSVQDKGMALLPERVNGRYCMITRQGGEYINIQFSDSLYFWNEPYQTLLQPEQPWEIIQLGNCGSPIRTDAGWLLLTHGVGPVRRYTLGLALLDFNDPTRVLARSREPLLEPADDEREGYVPNVVYTCGWLAHGDHVLMPYALSDSACGFATGRISELMRLLNRS